MRVAKVSPKVPIYKIQQSDPSPLARGYIKGGFGNFVSPYLDVYYNSTRKENYTYGVRATHFSSQNGPIQEDVSGQSYNGIDLFASFFRPKGLKISPFLSYQRYGTRFYGFNDTLTDVSVDTIRNNINAYKLGTSFSNNEPDKKVNHQGDISVASYDKIMT